MHDSLSEDVVEIIEVEVGMEGCSSRYAEPEAEGVSPVRRTLHSRSAWDSFTSYLRLHTDLAVLFRLSSANRMRIGLYARDSGREDECMRSGGRPIDATSICHLSA